MLLPFLTLVAATQVPKTFEELELDKIVAYHNLKNYREDMEIVITRKGERTVFLRTTKLDGDRSHVVITLPDGSKAEAVCDGSVGWAISHASKSYFEKKIDKNMPFEPKQSLLGTAPDTFNFTFNSSLPVQFALDPPLEIKSVETVKEDGQTLRKVVTSRTNSKGRTMTLTQWFLPDRWIVKHFNLDGEGEDGPVKLTGVTTKLSFDAKYTSADFALDPSLVSGYQKVDGG